MAYYKFDGSLAVETTAPTNNIYGVSAGGDTLTGGTSPTSLWAEGPNATLIGNSGSDTFYIQAAGAHISEAAGGAAEVVAFQNVNLSDYANIANLSVGGDKTYAAGNSADNIVYATGSNQQLFGGAGQDVLVGNGHNDTFIIAKGQGDDAIYNFDAGHDVVRLEGSYTSFADVQSHLSQVGSDVKLDMGGGDAVLIRNTQVGSLTSANFQLGFDYSKLGAQTFGDEFNGTSLSQRHTWGGAGTWDTDLGYQGKDGYGSYTLAGNGESEMYVNPEFTGSTSSSLGLNPFNVSNGVLTITANKVDAATASNMWGYDYTSGMISTKDTFSQTYGYFEMKASLPNDAGAWPAFWLIPADGSWPPELDVMETLSKDVHLDYTTEHSDVGGVHTTNSTASYVPDTTDGFHTYGVLWTPTTLTWYVDGAQVFQTATPADMNKPMYMIANLAMGGWGGAIDDSALSQAQMKIDYIHAYSLGDYANGAAGGGTTTTTTTAPTVATPATTTPTTTTTTAPPAPTPTTGASATNGVALTSHGFQDTVVGGAGNDTLTSFQGGETMTGGAGADTFVVKTSPWTPIHVTDFQVGVDKLDISGLYQGGYNGSDPIADGYVSLASDGHGGTEVLVDFDGHGAANPWPAYVMDLEGVSPTGLTSAQLFGGQSATSTPATSPTTTTTTTTPALTGQNLVSSGFQSTLAGGAGDDTLTSYQGGETMTGGAGADLIVVKTTPWTPIHVTDFQVGVDKLDISGLYLDGYKGLDPVADGYVRFADDGHGGTEVLVDPDGAGTGHPWPDYVMDLEGVSPTGLTAAQVFGSATTGASSTPATPIAPVVPGQDLLSSGFQSTLAGGAGNDTLTSYQGGETMTGGAGNDAFVFNGTPWTPVHITDFDPVHDKLDIRALFTDGYSGANPVADGYVTFGDDGHGGTEILVDPDGHGAGHPWPDYVADLEGVSQSQLSGTGWLVH